MQHLVMDEMARRRLVLEKIRLGDRREMLQKQMLELNKQIMQSRRLRTRAAQKAVKANLLKEFEDIRRAWKAVKRSEEEAERILGAAA